MLEDSPPFREHKASLQTRVNNRIVPRARLTAGFRGIALACSVVVAFAACKPAGAPPASEPMERPPNILLISLDTLRADHVGAYGYERDTSPFLDELAASGLLVKNAFINTLGTTPSHTTILSSLYQESHRMDYDRPEDGSIVPIPTDVKMLQEILGQEGYSTVAVTGGGKIHERFGFDRGFDHYDSSARGIEQGIRKLTSVLPERFEKPTFLLYHTYEIHSDYRPPKEYREMFGSYASDLRPTSDVLLELNKRDAAEPSEEDIAFLIGRYDGGIRYADDQLRVLFAELEARDFFDRFLVVITSDHGEEFGDHGHFLHQGYLYEELLKVPLILTGDRITGGQVVTTLASTVDIAPTVLSYVGIGAPTEMVGRDLLQPIVDSAPVFAQYGPRRYAVRTERYKLIEDRKARVLELFDLTVDPNEQVNLADIETEVVSELRGKLEQFRKENAPPPREATTVPIDPEHAERLRALGYL